MDHGVRWMDGWPDGCRLMGEAKKKDGRMEGRKDACMHYFDCW